VIFKLGAPIYFSILLAVYSASCSKSSSKSSPSGGGGSTTTSEIEVSGSISDDAAVEFVQSSDSVNIAGVNLTSAVSYVVTAYSLEPRGSKKLIFSGSFAERNFSFKSNVDRQYIVIEIKRLPDGGQFGAVLPPPSGSKKASVLVDGTTTIAAKMASVIARKAASGDQGAQHALTIGSVSLADILMVAQSVRRTVAEQKEQNKGSSIDLSALASNLVLKSNELVAKLNADGQAISQISEKLSEASYKTVFGEDAKVASPGILAYRVNPDLGSSAAATTSVAYEAIKASVSESMKPVDEAFRVEATAYRTAATVASAVAAETQVASSFKTVFDSCFVLPLSCAQAGYTPPAPPSTAIVNVMVPSSPTSLLGTVGNAQVALNWAAPSSNGGADIADYIIEFKRASEAVWTVFSDGVSVNNAAAVSGLDNGVTYNFRIAAKNSKGIGTYSEVISKTPLPTGCTGNGFCSVDGRHYVNGSLANGVVVDDKIVLLMHMDGDDNSTSFMDFSSSGFSPERVGAPRIRTTQSRFGGASAYFNGTGEEGSSERLQFGPSSALALGTEDFTIEAWFYQTGTSQAIPMPIEIGGPHSDSDAFGMWFHANSWDNPGFSSGYSSPYDLLGPATSLNRWTHAAWVRKDGNLTIFIDGIAGDSAPLPNNLGGDGLRIGGGAYQNHYNYEGYIDELRITKGLAQYTGNFTPATAAFPNAYVCYVNGQDSGSLNNVGTGWCPGNSKYYIGGAETSLSQLGDGNFGGRRYVGGIVYSGFDNGVCYVDGMSTNLVVDGKGACGGKYYIGGTHQPGLDSSGSGQSGVDSKYYVSGSLANGFVDDDKTVLLMHMDGADNSTVVTDSARGHSASVDGTAARISTGQSKFGGSSVYFDGSSGIQIDRAADLAFGGVNQDFTIEMWLHPTANLRNNVFFESRAPGSVGKPGFAISAANDGPTAFQDGFGFYDEIYRLGNPSTSGIALNTWSHFALVRSGTTVTYYINGVASGSQAFTFSGDAQNPSLNEGYIRLGAIKDGYEHPYNYIGYMDEVRITNGFARYHSNFTPPQSAFATVPKGYYLDGVLQPGD